MVGSPDPRRVRRTCVLLLAGIVPCLRAAAPIPLSLSELNRRLAPDLAPAHVGEVVAVRGVVNAAAFHFPQYTILGIQDDQGAGATLKVLSPGTSLEGFHPGDE